MPDRHFSRLLLFINRGNGMQVMTPAALQLTPVDPKPPRFGFPNVFTSSKQILG